MSIPNTENAPLQLQDLTVRNAINYNKHKCVNCESSNVLEYDDEIGVYICADCYGCMMMQY